MQWRLEQQDGLEVCEIHAPVCKQHVAQREVGAAALLQHGADEVAIEPALNLEELGWLGTIEKVEFSIGADERVPLRNRPGSPRGEGV